MMSCIGTQQRSHSMAGVGLFILGLVMISTSSSRLSVRRSLKTVQRVVHGHNNETIPKIIHQIYLGFDSNRQRVPVMPDMLLLKRENCRVVNAGYEMPIWGKAGLEHLIKTKYAYLWETWQGWESEWIKQADAARYILLNEYGGVYMDLDYSCEKPLESIVKDASLVLNRGRPGGENEEYIDNSFMASAPRHWFWSNVLPTMVERAHLSILTATGPNMLHKVLYDVCGEKPDVHYDPSSRAYFDPDLEKCGIKMATADVKYGVIRHHNTATWLGLYNLEKPDNSKRRRKKKRASMQLNEESKEE